MICGGSQQGGWALAGSQNRDVLEAGLLECLAVIAAANGRTIEDELNRAVKAYVVQEFSERGDERLIERAVSNSPAKAAS